MKKTSYILLAAAILAFSSCAKENAPIAPPQTQQESAGTVSGEVVIKFDASLSPLLDQVATKSSRSGIGTVDQLMELIGGYELERVFPYDSRNEERTRKSGLHLWYVVRFSQEQSVDAVLKKLSALGEVQTVSPVRVLRKAYNADRKPVPFNPVRTKGLEGDLFQYQWNLVNKGWHKGFEIDTELVEDPGQVVFDEQAAKNKFVAGADINCEDAWKKASGNPDIIVAVLDEGVFLSHPDLEGSIWVNEAEQWGSDEDLDGNGFAGDRYGYDFVKNTGKITWDSVNDTGHGTHVAGIIAARNDNKGIRSIAGGTDSKPGVKIMSCQIFSGDAAATNTLYMVRAIKYATDNGAVVLQCSWGYTSGAANIYDNGARGFRTEEEWAKACPLEKEILDYFRHNAGSADGPISGGIPVFAAGNEYAPMAGYPGASTGCVSVASIAADFTPSTFTNYSTGTTIAAPGGDQDYYYEFKGADHQRGAAGCILSTLPYHVSDNSGYGYMEGTSMACPHVSGVIALGLSYALENRRHYSADEFLELLYSSCSNLEYTKKHKLYYKYQIDVGNIQPQQLNLLGYNGKMGAGLVNTGAFLDKIAGGGVELHFPNIYLGVGATVAYSPMKYMDGPDYSIVIEDPSVAVVAAEGGEGSASVSGVAEGDKVVFTAKATGMTKAVIKSAAGSQEFFITVRKNATGPGWL